MAKPKLQHIHIKIRTIAKALAARLGVILNKDINHQSQHCLQTDEKRPYKHLAEQLVITEQKMHLLFIL